MASPDQGTMHGSRICNSLARARRRSKRAQASAVRLACIASTASMWSSHRRPAHFSSGSASATALRYHSADSSIWPISASVYAWMIAAQKARSGARSASRLARSAS